MNHRKRLLLVAPIGQYAIGQNFLRAFSAFVPRVAYINYLDYFPLPADLRDRVITRLTVTRRIKDYNQAIRDTTLWFKPDLIVIAKGVGVYPETLEEIRAKLPRALLTNINYDDFFSQSPSNNFSAIERIVPLFDIIFPSKKANVEELKDLGATGVHYLPLGYDETVHYPVSPNLAIKRQRGVDAIFVGTYTAERAKCLNSIADFNLSVWGGHWKRNKVRPDLWRRIRDTGNNRIIWGPELSAVLNSSKIALNFFRPDNRDTHNHRTFELPACGVFILSQRSDELGDFFQEGREIAMFSSIEELREKTRYYLDHDGERERMALAAHERLIRGKHTIRDRVEQMMKIIL